MTTRLILGACMLAQVAHAQSVAKPSLARATTQRETETGSWRSGDAMVWMRVAPTGAISVYASHGYRSAFAHAITITPEDADKWAEIGDHLLAGQAAGGAVMLADSDLALEPARAGDSVVLAVRLGGVRPDGITFLMNGQSLREVMPILRATARASRATQAANAAPPAPAPAPTAAAAAPVATPAAAAPAATTPAANTPAANTPAATTPATSPATPAAQQPPQPHTAAIAAPAPVAPVALASAPSAPVAPPEVAASNTPPAPAPEAEVAPVSSSTPVVSVASSAAAAPATAAPAAAAPAVAASAVAAPAVAAPAVAASVAPAPAIAPSKPVQVATTTPPSFSPTVPTKVVKVTQTKLVAQSTETASLRRTSAGSIAKPVSASAHTEPATDATKLAASTVANLVQQWQSQLDLCYTEYGLKVNPALTGSIAVRLAIRATGDVGAATFTRHTWSGAGGTEAESCMRARVMSWMFPPASTPSAHEFTVAFAP